MRYALLAAALASTAAAVVASCTGRDAPEASLPPARPVDSSGCSPVTYGGGGEPDFLIATMTALQGQLKDPGIQVAQAMKLVLAEREWRAGDYTVGLQVCDEVTAASRGGRSPVKCRRTARAFARNRSVIVVHGPLSSHCASEAIPILNRAPGGPLAQTLAGATYVGLTRSGPGIERDEPERYFPTGRRSVVRITPPDDVLGAAGAMFAQRDGARRAFVLNHGEAYGFGVAEAFRVAGEHLGLDIVGAEAWDADAPNYRALAERVGRAGADTVYLGGYALDNGPRLISDLREALGPEARIIGSDGFNQPGPIVEGAGEAAEGFVTTISVLPISELPSRGQEFAAEFEERFGARPCCYTVHTAQATHMMLDAIEASDGTRAQVLENLFSARVEDGYVGDFTIDRTGDATVSTIVVYEIQEGRLSFKTALVPPSKLFAPE